MDAKYVQECYDKNHVLSSCNDIVLEAKRVILNEQLEKIANIALSNFTKPQLLHQTVNDGPHMALENNFQNQISKMDNLDEEDMVLEKTENNFSVNEEEKTVLENDRYNTPDDTEVQVNDKRIIESGNEILPRNDDEANNTNEDKQIALGKLNQQEKLEAFIEKIKSIKKNEVLNKSAHFERNSQTAHFERNYSGKSRSSYKNRFMVQKSIIDLQKAKLDEQNKIIEELKLGIIREDILKSIEHTKINIREIFAGCSEKIKCKVPIVYVQENKFNVNIQKAPKIVQQMEERAIERARNREIILERKKLVEEMRQKMLEEAIEKKRVLEEEERKRTLEIMKERRKKELELERIRHEKRKIYEEKLHKAIAFHEVLLKQQCLRKLYNNVIFSREKHVIAVEHYRKKVLRESFNIWMNFVDSLYIVKYEIADAHFSYKIFRKCMETLKQVRLESIRNMQVAQDLYDFRLTSNVFICWHRQVCKQIMMEMNKMKVAVKHYDRHLLFHCFYQWRSLKAVLELEKAKELKKRKWREKVWEILPDYKPPEDF